MKRKPKTDSTKSYSLEEIMDETMGKIGTPVRDRYEIKMLFWRVGNNIKDHRKELGLSQEDLALLTGLSLKDIAKMERGGVTTPIPSIQKVWQQLSKEKRSHKHRLTKQSSSFRTIVR